MRTITIDLDAEAITVEKLKVEWLAAKAAKEAAVIVSSQHKTNPGDSYWQAEHKARLRYEAAFSLLMNLEQAAVERGGPECS